MAPDHEDHDHPMGDDVHDLQDEEQDPEGEDYINPDDIEIIDADDYDGDLPMDEDDDGYDEGEGEDEQPSAPVEDNSLAQNGMLSGERLAVGTFTHTSLITSHSRIVGFHRAFAPKFPQPSSGGFRRRGRPRIHFLPHISP